MIRLAVQKSGRLSEETTDLIRESGIELQNSTKALAARASNFPLEVLYLRDDDIPGYVADKVADAGIVGENVVNEKAREVTVVEKLGFSKCRLSIAVPKASLYQNVKDLHGLNIATSYPRILAEFLKKNKVTASIHEISGSAEIAPSIGLADAICDLVRTGSTLVSNGLRELCEVQNSEAVLISNEFVEGEKRTILNDLLFRINAVKRARRSKYIILNTPNVSIQRIIEILPGLKSPTITPLATEGWSSMHSVVDEDEFWSVIRNLREAGAQGILVLPIEKMIV